MAAGHGPTEIARGMVYTPGDSGQDWGNASPSEAGPWAPAFSRLVLLMRLWRRRILLCATLFAGLAMAAKAVFPGNYVASEQLLFDPEGVKIFSTDVPGARQDANAQVNFVESQMGVILSERVLARVIARECALGDTAPDALETTGEVAPPPNFQRLCPNSGSAPILDTAKAIEALRKLIVVKRAERSFLVDVTATGATPEFAAQLASAVVKAYIDEDAASRAAAAARLTNELNVRLETIRREIAESEAQAEGYRSDKNLIRVGDKLLAEQKLADGATALNAAQSQLERARARVRQLETTPLSATGLGALGDETETRPLALLLDRRAAALADLAPLQSTLGARHPLLVQARSRVAETERDIAAELKTIRAAARDQFDRAVRERDNLGRSVDQLSAEVTRARRAQIALQTLEQAADANRKLLESFENRSREAAETGRIDLANLRVASQARAPEPRLFVVTMALWGFAGFVLGLLLAISGVAFLATLGAAANVAGQGDEDLSDHSADDPSRSEATMRREISPQSRRAYS